MLSRKYLFVALLLVSLAMLAATSGRVSHAQREGTVRVASAPSSVRLEADITNISICPGDNQTARVQLRAVVNPTPGHRIESYRWRVTGGTLRDEGATAVWDLTDAVPGRAYAATVEVTEVTTTTPVEKCLIISNLVPVTVTKCEQRIVCPNLVIYCPDTVAPNAPVNFSVEASGGTPGVTPVFNWKVSAGQITGGQGTTSITVDTAGLAGQPITATVEVAGYNLTCTATCTTQPLPPREGEKCDSYGPIRFNDEKARLDNCAIELQNQPGAKFYIVVHGDRNNPDWARRRAARARDYLVNERGISADRIVVIEGAPRGTLTTELWIVPVGATPPRPNM